MYTMTFEKILDYWNCLHIFINSNVSEMYARKNFSIFLSIIIIIIIIITTDVLIHTECHQVNSVNLRIRYLISLCIPTYSYRHGDIVTYGW